MSEAIELNNLQVFLIDQFMPPTESQTLRLGSDVVLLGENGSGKTSILETLVGLRQFRGSAKILGDDIGSISENVRRRIGVQFQAPGFNENYLVGDLVHIHSKVFNATGTYHKILFDIKELYAQKFEKLSTGQKRRVSLYLALAHEPDVVFLDEPSAGLDVDYRERFLDVLDELTQNPARSTVISTHDDEEAIKAGQTWLVNKGQLSQAGSPRTLARETLADFKFAFGFNTLGDAEQFVNRFDGLGIDLRWEENAPKVIIFADYDFRETASSALNDHSLVEFSMRQTKISDVIQFMER